MNINIFYIYVAAVIIIATVSVYAHKYNILKLI